MNVEDLSMMVEKTDPLWVYEEEEYRGTELMSDTNLSLSSGGGGGGGK